jgi:hypothetical protein
MIDDAPYHCRALRDGASYITQQPLGYLQHIIARKPEPRPIWKITMSRHGLPVNWLLPYLNPLASSTIGRFDQITTDAGLSASKRRTQYVYVWWEALLVTRIRKLMILLWLQSEVVHCHSADVECRTPNWAGQDGSIPDLAAYKLDRHHVCTNVVAVVTLAGDESHCHG